MSQFNNASRLLKPNDTNKSSEETVLLASPNRRKATPKVPFVLRLERNAHEQLKSIAEAEDRSMQWMLRKLTSEGIKKKAEELGIAV